MELRLEFPNSFLESANLTVSFVKSGYATVSRSPTKIREYLACGLPIISNTGVGDVDEQIQTNRQVFDKVLCLNKPYVKCKLFFYE
jgi:hypothetical protein